ncbi:MAG: hydroxymethylglutaryl-CoA reductase, degradative [Pseudomonadota bacterium]
MERSCIPEFYKLSVAERVRKVRDKGLISSADFKSLSSGAHTLDISGADKMIENVIGVMGLPVGLGLNFLVNGKDYVIPLVVEEPSIVAALSSAAKVVRKNGGFDAKSDESLLIGQIQLVDLADPARAKTEILNQKDEILTLANGMNPRMVTRGGGAKDLEVFIHTSEEVGDMVVVHILVDTCDAMGANAINSMCEGIAPLIERIADGKVFLRILSNLTDRALAKASCRIPVANLASKSHSGEAVRDGVIIASELARVDPYRAATHNKGIMNGVDSLALATGNDWRALEAGAHAYAARSGQYTSLTKWYKADNGDLVGEIELPVKVGIVGGPLQSNPTVAVNLRMLGVDSAKELAELMAAVGLAQNFAAIRALATDGIQKGHMTLHARTVASAAGASEEVFDLVVENLIESGEIKVWKAKELIQSIESKGVERSKDDLAAHRGEEFATAHAKVILLGEHSVVYGRHALAAPIPLAVQARIRECENGLHFLIPRWDVEHRLHRRPQDRQSFEKPAARILETLGLLDRNMIIEVYPNVPRAMGLGSSAAVAVAIVRALDQHFQLKLSDAEVSNLAFEAEKIAHGTPSGIDNTLATFGETVLFRRGEPPIMQPIEMAKPLELVVGISGVRSLTAKTVADVRAAWQQDPDLYERIFDEIDRITLHAVEAIAAGDVRQLGQLMNVCHGQLNALQVSSWELEELVQIARTNGALGAKLTGGGGGGSIVALADGNSAEIAKAIKNAGYEAMEVKVGE